MSGIAAELEAELELEGEGEQELSHELEQELELTHELEGEGELEHEQEAEHEAFFNHLSAMADRSGRSQALRRIALAAARQALRANRVADWPVIQGEGEAELELELELGEHEGSHEFESHSPAQQAQALAMMEHAGHSAAEAANEQEAAEHFLPLVGLAAKFVLPKLVGFAAKKLGGMAVKKIGGRLLGRVGGQLLRRVGPRMMGRVAPRLTRGLANVTRTLFRNRSTRPLLHAVPRIARTTVARLGRQIASGRRITPQQAVRTLAQQTARTLSNPRILSRTYNRSIALDRRYHRHTRRVLGRPVGAPVRVVNDTVAAPAYAGMPAAPGFPVAMPSVAGWTTQNTGGCRCTCQPMGAAVAPAVPVMHTPVPVNIPQMPTTCPTCGR